MGIVLTEEPYDGPVAAPLLDGLLLDLNERYPVVGLDDAAIAAVNEEWRAEVTPADVRAPHGTFLVAWLDGEPVGCGAVKRYVPHDGSPGPSGEAEVKRMYTVPAARRHGVGRHVLRRLEARAVELGYRSLRLETGTPQHEAMAMYEAAGWQRIAPYGTYRDSPLAAGFAKDLVQP